GQWTVILAYSPPVREIMHQVGRPNTSPAAPSVKGGAGSDPSRDAPPLPGARFRLAPIGGPFAVRPGCLFKGALSLTSRNVGHAAFSAFRPAARPLSARGRPCPVAGSQTLLPWPGRRLLGALPPDLPNKPQGGGYSVPQLAAEEHPLGRDVAAG